MLTFFVATFLFMSVKSFFWLDPDLGWHLFLGQKMSESGHLIQNAVGYNYFANLQIPDHEWLSDVLLYRLSQIGIWAISVFFLLVSFVLAFLLYKIASHQAKSKSSILVALLLVTLALSFSYGLRLQVLLFVAIALFIYVNQSVSSIKIRYFFYFLIIAIGTNLHGGFLTIFPVPVFLELPLQRLSEWRKTSYKKWLALLLIICLALLANPYGTKFWQLASGYASNRAYLSSISEWLPIYVIPIHLWNIIVPLSIILFCFTINKYWQKLSLNHKLLLGLYGVAGVLFSRFFAVFVLVSLPALVSAIDDVETNVLHNKKMHWIPLSAVSLFVCGFLALNYQNRLSQTGDPFSDKYYPSGASEYLMTNNTTRGNLLNPHSWGGYLLWKNRDQKIFTDGRGPQIAAEGQTSTLEIYQKFNNKDGATIKTQLEKYNITSILLDTTNYQLNPLNAFLMEKAGKSADELFGTPNLKHYLENSPDWKKVYEDNISAVYFKKVTE